MARYSTMADDPLMNALKAVAECGTLDCTLAPRQPTAEMIAAGVSAGALDESTVLRIYDAMITKLD